MNDVFGALRAVSDVLRYVLFVVALIAALIAAADWAVRTRRLNPFGGTARFFRRTIDPLMLPIERRVVRAGGRPASAPLWALGTVVVGGLLVIALFDFLTRQLAVTTAAVSLGGRGVLVLLISWTFAILRLALIVRVLSTWVGASPYAKWLRWTYGLTEWMLAPLRRVIPLLGAIDVTPIVAYLLLQLVQGLIIGTVAG